MTEPILIVEDEETLRRNLARWQGRIEQAAGVLLILLGLAMAVA